MKTEWECANRKEYLSQLWEDAGLGQVRFPDEFSLKWLTIDESLLPIEWQGHVGKRHDMLPKQPKEIG